MNKLCAKSFCFVLTITLVSGECVWNSTEIARQFPSFVLVELMNSYHYCGGVIIDEQHVLISVGCLEDYYQNLIEPAGVFVHFDFLNCDQLLPVSKIYTIPDDSINGNNLAILKLGLKIRVNENDRQDAVPAKVSFLSYKKQKSCTNLSWNRINDTNNFKYALSKVIYNTKPIFFPNSFCVAPQDGSTLGSLGSALFCNGELVGIGYGRICFELTNEAFAKIDSYLKWILETLEKSRFEDMNYENSSATFTVSAVAIILSLLAML